MSYAGNEGPDQPAHSHSDQGLHKLLTESIAPDQRSNRQIFFLLLHGNVVGTH